MKESPRDLLQFLARSDTRVTVLAALTTDQASSTRSDLQRETGIPRSTLSRILSELGDRELVSTVGHRYEVTLLGRFLAGRLHSVCDSVEAMQKLQTLLNQLSDTESAITFTDSTRGEILIPTSVDPEAPTRRFADLLQTASYVRLLIPATIPLLFDVCSAIGDGKQTVDIVMPRLAFEVERDNSMFSQQLRDVTASGAVTLFSYDGDIPHLAGMMDEIAVVGLIDDAGTVQGYVETNDETVRSWSEAVVEAYQRNAGRVTSKDLTE